MHRLTPQGQQSVEEIAQRYGISTDAVLTVLAALVAGHGTMAQFHHPELGGAGQWMQGGMTMVGDMFHQALQAKVQGLCAELVQLVAQQPSIRPSTDSPSQSQSQSGRHSLSPAVSLCVPAAPGPPSHWWPAEFGIPSSAGAQNNLQYAYFPALRRLAIAINGQVTVYDTLEHQIRGVAQQQSAGASLTFTSQCGGVPLASLPVVSVDGVPPVATSLAPQPVADVSAPAGQSQEEILATLERLADLHTKGILSAEEFAATKAALLQRL